MLKAKELRESVWNNNKNDYMKVQKVKGGWVAVGNSYDLQDTTANGIQKQLKNNGFKFLGWD